MSRRERTPFTGMEGALVIGDFYAFRSMLINADGMVEHVCFFVDKPA